MEIVGNGSAIVKYEGYHYLKNNSMYDLDSLLEREFPFVSIEDNIVIIKEVIF